MDKLHKVLKVRRQQEEACAQALARSQQARADAERQRQQLDDMAQDYRNRHAQIENGNVQQFRAFQSFYAQLNAAVGAQQEVLNRTQFAEQNDSDRFIAQHRERRALEKLLEQRDAVLKNKQQKRERRSTGATRRNPMV